MRTKGQIQHYQWRACHLRSINVRNILMTWRSPRYVNWGFEKNEESLARSKAVVSSRTKRCIRVKTCGYRDGVSWPVDPALEVVSLSLPFHSTFIQSVHIQWELPVTVLDLRCLLHEVAKAFPLLHGLFEGYAFQASCLLHSGPICTSQDILLVNVKSTINANKHLTNDLGSRTQLNHQFKHEHMTYQVQEHCSRPVMRGRSPCFDGIADPMPLSRCTSLSSFLSFHSYFSRISDIEPQRQLWQLTH